MKLARLQAGQFVETGGDVTKGDGGQARYLVTAGASPNNSVSPDLANGNHALYQGVGAVNDLSQTYIFDTVVAFKASLIEFPDGKTIHLKDRGADFTKISGTVGANIYDLLASTSVNQSIVLIPSYPSDPKEYGAVVGTDITAVINHITGADLEYGNYEEKIVDLKGRDYDILGTVYVRKGQHLDGSGSHIFMSDTGSIKCGERSNGDVDPSGHPITISSMWLEGGNKPIDCFVSGYTIRDIFSSFAAVGLQFGGSDAHISNVTMDNGATLLACSMSNSTIVNCIFYVGVTQLDLTGQMRDTVFSNCVFNYGNTYGIRMYDPSAQGRTFKNIRFDGCSFKKNAQNAGTFKGFIWTNNSGMEGDVTFSDCNFRNCFGPAINVESSSAGLELNFDGCIFDGEKTNIPYDQSTTMYALDINAAGKNTVNMNNCTFKNLLDTPMQTSSNEAYQLSLANSKFSNNVGTHNLDINGSNGASHVSLSNIDSGGKALFDLPVAGTLEVFGYLRNWLPVKNTAGRDYIEIPFFDATMVDMKVVMNRNPNGSTQYRQLSKLTTTIGYDFVAGVNTQGTITETFASTSPLGGTLDIQLDIDTVGAGIALSGRQDKGLMVISWPDSYGNETIEAEYEIING